MYELHTLGWHSFQQLCLTIVREILGQTVESFLDSNDGGRDGAFAGQWSPTGKANEHLTGRFVIQCKFTSKSNWTLRLSDISDEVEKVTRLVKQGHCDSYVLLTNAGVSGKQTEAIEERFKAAGAKHVVVLGSTWICQQIRESKRLRMLVPRVYGLGDLSQILDERAYSQACAVLESLREDLGRIVVTGAYWRAVEALDKHGFVLLIGEPATGKTTLASLLAVSAVDQWQASVLKLDNPEKVVEHWNPDEQSQFFWLDDAFGVTQYEDFLVRGWNHVFPQIKAMLRRGAKIVMTSRDYIYNRARKDLKEGTFPLLQESQVVIDVHDLTFDEKRQILYNHLKLGRQPTEFRSKVKPYLESVATHERFIPETARRLAEPLFTDGLYIDRYNLGQFIEKRERLLQEILQSLDRHSKAALALIYMRNDRLESPIDLQVSEEQALERLGSDLGGCVTALDALNGSLVQYIHASGDSIWRFKHPTIGDAYAAILVLSPELLGIYVQGSTTEKLIKQVTCGDVGIQNAVIIPKGLFPLMLHRLSEMHTATAYKDAFLAKWEATRGLLGFLTRRCSKEFLTLYLERNPDLLDKVSEPGLLLSAVPEVDLAVRLHEFGLLPEERRGQFIATVSDYALDGLDLFALQDPGIRSVFEDHEFEELLVRVRTELLPRLHDVRWDWESNHDSGLSPDDHMQPLLDSFETLKKLFSNDETAVKIIERESQHAIEWIGEHMPEDMYTKPRRKLGDLQPSDDLCTERSIFDDVDDDGQAQPNGLVIKLSLP
jgi:hypothetical protein